MDGRSRFRRDSILDQIGRLLYGQGRREVDYAMRRARVVLSDWGSYGGLVGLHWGEGEVVVVSS